MVTQAELVRSAYGSSSRAGGSSSRCGMSVWKESNCWTGVHLSCHLQAVVKRGIYAWPAASNCTHRSAGRFDRLSTHGCCSQQLWTCSGTSSDWSGSPAHVTPHLHIAQRGVLSLQDEPQWVHRTCHWTLYRLAKLPVGILPGVVLCCAVLQDPQAPHRPALPS